MFRYVIETIGQMKRNYVSRRLLFDDEEKISVNKHISQQLFNNSEPTDVLEEKVSNNKIISLQTVPC